MTFIPSYSAILFLSYISREVAELQYGYCCCNVGKERQRRGKLNGINLKQILLQLEKRNICNENLHTIGHFAISAFYIEKYRLLPSIPNSFQL